MKLLPTYTWRTLQMVALGVAGLLAGGLSAPQSAAADGWTSVDPNVPAYSSPRLQKTELSSVGSDSMGGLMEIWVEHYRQAQPEVEIKVASQGSATAAAALIEGSADIGPMAREMKEVEVEEFKSRYGFEPTQVRTALAGVAIYVNAENPLSEITVEQLDAIYSSQRNRGATKTLTTWGSVGVTGSLAPVSIMAVASNAHPTTKSYFKQQVMLQSEFLSQVTETASLQGLFDTIKANKGAIAFGEFHTPPAGVRVVAVSRKTGESAVVPTIATLTSEEYPLGRYLNVYLVREPGQTIEPATKEFLRFVLSRQGQELVGKRGLVPLPASVVTKELEKIS